MRRGWRIALGVAGGVLALPFVLVGLVLVAANTGAGQRLIAREVTSLTGGTVVLQGLSGRFPDALRLAHAELHDAKGTYLSLDTVVLDWSPLALIGGDAHVTLLSVARLDMPRLPAPSPAQKPAPASKGGFSLPVRVDIDALHAARVDLGAPVALKPAVLKIDGDVHLASLEKGKAKIAVQRLDGDGTYTLVASLGNTAIDAHLTANEPPGGFVGGLANLPDLGAISLDAAIEGPRDAERTTLSLNAGALTAQAKGTIDIPGQTAALDLTGNAPAMSPRPDLSWAGITLQAHVQGPFTKPDVNAHAVVSQFKGGGASLGTLTLDASGNRGSVQAKAVMDGLVIPGPKPDLFAASPLIFSATAQLDDKSLPITFSLRHALVSADGTAKAGGDIAANIHTTVPDLAPFAAMGKVDIRGSTEATASMAVHGNTTDVSVDGTADFTGGQAPVPALLGHTTYGATASLTGQNIVISRTEVNGRAVHASVTGTDTAKGLDLKWKLALSDLAALSAQARGQLQASGTVQGPQTGLAVQAHIKGRFGTDTVPEGPIDIAVQAQNLPASPTGSVTAKGSFAGAPVTLNADLSRDASGTLHATLHRADWKSLSAQADMTLAPGARLPAGMLTARMSRLADLQPVLHQAVSGAFDAKVTTSGGAHPDAKIDVTASHVAASGSAVGRAVLTGTVRDPASKNPDLSLSLALTGIDAPNAQGDAHLTVAGTLDALALRADSHLQAEGAPATVTTAALLDVPGKKVTLQSLSADYKGETLRLAAPAHVVYGARTAVDQLRLGLGAATLSVSGSVAPRLDLTASLRNVTPDLAKPFAPGVHAAGTLTADARLTGTPAAPSGTIRLHAEGLRIRTGPAASLPAASIEANASLDGATARIDAHLAAGPKLHLTANGTAPLRAGGAIAMRVDGGLDLALLNPVLNAQGRRAAGRISLAATVGGTSAAPRINGGVTLADGEVQDFVQGLHIEKIGARIEANGDTVTIARFSGEAGPGTIGMSGTVGITAPGMPIDLHVTAHDARPLASDLLTAYMDADVAIKGEAAGNMQVHGSVFVRRAEINIPNSLPTSVPTLNVRYPGEKPPKPAPPAPPTQIALDLVVNAPNSMFVRGHGLDAELGGKLTIAGNTAAPQISGGFQMRRGDISVAGTTLTFTKGEVSFDGTSVTNKIDPTLDFVADSLSQSVDATLTVGGYADAPKITLSSVPDLPQDEVLAHLLFQRSVKDLSAVQIAEIGAALAELSGVTGGGGDPLAAVRKGLGLDRLSVGGGTGNSNGASVEAGRYVARGVYVGAKQNTSGGTAAEVQVDLTKRLKLTSQLATGGGSVQGATPDDDPGSTIGLSYGFDY